MTRPVGVGGEKEDVLLKKVGRDYRDRILGGLYNGSRCNHGRSGGHEGRVEIIMRKVFRKVPILFVKRRYKGIVGSIVQVSTVS